MKECTFCGVALHKANRSREHLLKHSWLVKLGHTETDVRFDFLAGGQVVDARSLPADSVLIGDICCSCNNGWMQRVDAMAEPAVLGLATRAAFDVSPTIETDLAHWLFKTGFAFSGFDQSSRRHVPTQRRRELAKGIMPVSYVTFMHKRVSEDRHVAAALLDAFPLYVSPVLDAPQEERFKFGVQYDSIIFGCAYSDDPNATFILKPGLHELIEARNTNILYENDWDELELPPSVANTTLNYVVATLGLR